MAILPPFIVEDTPELKPRRFGALSVVDFTDTSDARFLGGVEFETNGCLPDIGIAAELCTPQDPKTVTEEEDQWVSGFAFTGYVVRECRAIGDYQNAANRATTLYTQGEQNAIEQALWGYLTENADAVDLTPGNNTQNAYVGLAVLEAWAGANYAGDPVIHVTRDTGSLLASQRATERHGNKIESVQGAAILSGGGYGYTGPQETPAVASEAWMFVTGKIRGWRGNAIQKGPFLVQEPLDNTHISITERPYALAIDCGIAAVRVFVS